MWIWGIQKYEVAATSKVYGVIMTLVGAFIGGALTIRFGILRILMLGAILSAASNLLFAWLATVGHDILGLIFVISADNLSSGIASAAFIAFISSLTNVQYSATQYALFSSDDADLTKVACWFFRDVCGLLWIPIFLCFYCNNWYPSFTSNRFGTTTSSQNSQWEFFNRLI
jgi:hypothetical protein